MKRLGRREFFALSTLGIIGAAMPAKLAFADEKDVVPAKKYVPELVLTGDPEVDDFNRYSLEKWEAAVEEALSERQEIITVNNPSEQMPMPRSYYHIAYAHYNETLDWVYTDHFVFTASGQATTASRWGDISGCGMYSADGWMSPTVNTYSYTRIDDGRTLAVDFTVYIVYAGALHKTTTRHYYVEFYTTGDGWVAVR